jgi:hypothetical protein
MTRREYYEWWFLIGLVSLLGLMSLVFGVFHVQETTSYGLKDVLDTLRDIALAFVGYMFRQSHSPNLPGNLPKESVPGLLEKK